MPALRLIEEYHLYERRRASILPSDAKGEATDPESQRTLRWSKEPYTSNLDHLQVVLPNWFHSRYANHSCLEWADTWRLTRRHPRWWPGREPVQLHLSAWRAKDAYSRPFLSQTPHDCQKECLHEESVHIYGLTGRFRRIQWCDSIFDKDCVCLLQCRHV